MVTVNSRELKNRLGKYLRMVRDGERIRITDRGEPVAFIVPVIGDIYDAEDLRSVIAKGRVTFGSGRLSISKPALLGPGQLVTVVV